jgi:phosphohistidine phosphatase
MRLYLVQHGDAVPEQSDPERPLSAAGRRDVEAVARLLARNAIRAERVAHSGKLRAQQTAELLAAALAPGIVLEARAGLNPNDPVEPVARRVANMTSEVVLVGHLPLMGKLVARLVAGDERKPVAAFVPGTVVCLEQGETSRWAVTWMVRPEKSHCARTDLRCVDTRRATGCQMVTERTGNDLWRTRAGARSHSVLAAAPVVILMRRASGRPSGTVDTGGADAHGALAAGGRGSGRSDLCGGRHRSVGNQRDLEATQPSRSPRACEVQRSTRVLIDGSRILSG